MLDDRARALALVPELAAIIPQLELYESFLRRWQPRINLVGASTLGHLWSRHFADAGQLVRYAPEASTWVDLGSGGGFPGLIIALLHPKAKVRLVESDTRKAAFLREVSRETGARAEVATSRAEDVIADERAPDVVSSRALAALPDLTALVASWVAEGTMGLFLTGATDSVGALPPILCVTRNDSLTGSGFVVSVKQRESGQV